jgi:hypothetical protein
VNLLLSDVIWVALFIAIVGIWWHGQGVKAQALIKVKRYCEEHNLQLLDESLVIRKLWFGRTKNGALSFKRTYFFEFTSTGEYRYRATVIMLGYQLLEIDAQTHHLQ